MLAERRAERVTSDPKSRKASSHARSPLPYAPCSLLSAPYPLPIALCSLRLAPCTAPFALCPSPSLTPPPHIHHKKEGRT